MLFGLFLICAVGLAFSTLLLVLLGHRLRIAWQPLGFVVVLAVALGSGELAKRIWRLPSSHVTAGVVLLTAVGTLVVLARRDWNPVGQVFFGMFLSSAVVYLSFATYATFGTGLSSVAMAASTVLLVFEVLALTLACSFAFESLDVTCRVRWRRVIRPPDPEHRPFVSLQIAAYNEPAEMLIETIRSVASIDYPSFEVVVIDNNTPDPEVWRPVEEFCNGQQRVTFVHVEHCPGYKAGALNRVLKEYTDPAAELIGVVDADYLVDPSYLDELVGYFADPSVAYVQCPQDYRDWTLISPRAATPTGTSSPRRCRRGTSATRSSSRGQWAYSGEICWRSRAVGTNGASPRTRSFH